jgi:hypothetical protein
MEVDGGVPPASPTPTPIRAASICQKVCASPQQRVMKDQRTSAPAMMLRRLERSAHAEMGSPIVT